MHPFINERRELSDVLIVIWRNKITRACLHIDRLEVAQKWVPSIPSSTHLLLVNGTVQDGLRNIFIIGHLLGIINRRITYSSKIKWIEFTARTNCMMLRSEKTTKRTVACATSKCRTCSRMDCRRVSRKTTSLFTDVDHVSNAPTESCLTTSVSAKDVICYCLYWES